MAKARLTVDEKGLELIERARELSKLRAKHQRKCIELAELHEEIAVLQDVVSDLVAGETKA